MHLSLALATVLPRVESPWPESIGLDFPFAAGGAGGFLAGALVDVTDERRDRWIHRGGLWGFRGGALLYLFCSAVQVVSAL